MPVLGREHIPDILSDISDSLEELLELSRPKKVKAGFGFIDPDGTPHYYTNEEQ